jgi:hypothetical protein
MNMKLYKNLGFGLALLVFTSCSDYLDKETFDIITPKQVWQEPKLINGVLANLYDGLQLEDFNYWYGNVSHLKNPTTMSDEAQGSYQQGAFSNGNTTYTYEDALFEETFSARYRLIRNCNDFIKQVEEVDVLSDTDKKLLLGEVRFIRAMHYFTLVKRYGGVPLIDIPQEYDPNNLEALMVPRNKEAEVYDFIVKECQESANVLPVTQDATAKYRANKGAALALCSRAALYAGSIAKYGTVQLDGVVGIAASESSRFYQASLAASQEIISLGVYSLYNKTPDDKSKNYCDIFLKGNGDNGEYIFQKQYNVAGGKGHDWDKRNVPFSYTGGGWGCGVCPTLEMIEEYECTDGSIKPLQLTDDKGSPVRLENPYDLFQGRDPRLYASIYMPGSPIRGSEMEWYRGIIDTEGNRYQAANQPGSGGNEAIINGVIYNTTGKDGGADVGDGTKTSFNQKKFIDETLTNMDLGQSETPWPVFRLGEIYLNLSEAAMELGKNPEALQAVNTVRERAGMPLLTTIDIDKVRHERRIELAFEGHRFWDMRRWRIAHLDVAQGGLNGFRGTALYPWLDITDNKFIFERGNTPKQVRIFLNQHYYLRINTSDINSNPKLVQNPGYTN